MFIVKFMQENYHSGDVTFRYLTLGDKDINKSVYKLFLNHFNFLTTIGTDSIIDLDYYCF